MHFLVNILHLIENLVRSFQRQMRGPGGIGFISTCISKGFFFFFFPNTISFQVQKKSGCFSWGEGRLLHPFMPFVTEELWQRLPRAGGAAEAPSIMVAAYPSPLPSWTDPSAEADMEVVRAVVTKARSQRTGVSLLPSLPPSLPHPILPPDRPSSLLPTPFLPHSCPPSSAAPPGGDVERSTPHCL